MKVNRSPIQQLPCEILLEIFNYSTHEYQCGYDVFDTSKGPWILGQVCSTWRTMTLLHASLWASEMYITLESMRRCRDPLYLFDTVLQRIGTTRPFTFSLNLADFVGPYILAVDLGTPILKKLVSRSSQWKSARLENIPPNLVEILSSARSNLPRLRTVKLTVSAMAPFTTSPIVSCSAFDICPSLETLEVDNVYTPHIQHAPRLTTFANETVFEGDKAREVDHLFKLLSQFPDLRYLTAHAEWENERGLDTKLQIHQLNDLDSSNLELMNSIVTPSLQSFAGCGRYFANGLSDFLPAVHGLLTRSACSLTYLDLSDFMISDSETMLSILRASPQLEEFHLLNVSSLNGEDGLGAVFHAMAETTTVEGKSRHKVVPNLKQLSFDDSDVYESYHDHCLDALVGMIVSRHLSHSVLNWIRVCYVCGCEERGIQMQNRAAKEELRRMAANGVDLRFMLSQYGSREHSDAEEDDYEDVYI